MNTYKFEVNEKYTPSPLNGEIVAASEKEAIQELKESYAQDLGTVESEIDVKILGVKKTTDNGQSQTT